MEEYTFGITPNQAKRIKAHAHCSWEVVYYIEGEGTLVIGDREIHFSPGTIVCQPPNIVHYEQSEKGFRNIYFHSRSFMPPNSSQVSVYRDNAENDFGSIMKIALKMYVLDNPSSRTILQNLISVIKDYFRMWDANDISANKQVEAVKSLIISNFANCSFNLTEELRGMGYCADHIRRLFKSECGKTPNEYLLQVRIENAKKLLGKKFDSEKLTVKEAAYMSGFSDPFHFSKLYKKMTGEAPSETLAGRAEVVCVPEDSFVCLQ